MGVEVRLVVKTDASAAKGIAMRKGFGKVRQVEVNQLWVQDRVARGDSGSSKNQKRMENLAGMALCTEDWDSVSIQTSSTRSDETR
jgi:hypothetical protein